MTRAGFSPGDSPWKVMAGGTVLMLLCACAHASPSAGHGGSHPGGGQSAGSHASHAALGVAGSVGHGHAGWSVPGHGWHGHPAHGVVPFWAWGPAYGWTGAAWAGSYDPWWWYPPAPIYDVAPGDMPETALPPQAAEPVPYRFFCPTNSIYYPEVSSCPVPWLRVLPDR